MSILGKKWTMIGMGVPFALGILLIVFAKSSAMLIIGRLLYGSSGAFAVLVPAYTSEISEQSIKVMMMMMIMMMMMSIKGALGSLQQLINCMGCLFVGVLGKYVEWRLMTGIFLFIPVLMSVWMFFMPESPVFLVAQGKMDQAKDSLLFLRGPQFDAESELTKIRKNVEASKVSKSIFTKLFLNLYPQDIGSIGFRTLMTTHHYLVPALISMTLMFLQHFSGVNAVLTNAIQLFEVIYQ